MAYEIFDGTDMVRQLFGEGQGVTDEARDALPHRIVKPLNVIGFAGFFGDGFMLCRRNDPGVDGILIRRERRLLAVCCRYIRPQLFRTLMTAIPHVERNDLPCLLVHGDPDPLLVSLFRHKAPHLVRFYLKTPDDHLSWSRDRPHMQMIRQRRKAGSYKAHKPSDTDTHGPANAMEGDFLAEQACHESPLLLSNHAICRVQDKLPAAGLALMVLLPSICMAIFLKLLGCTLGTHVSHVHDLLLPSLVSAGNSDQQYHGSEGRALPV